MPSHPEPSSGDRNLGRKSAEADSSAAERFLVSKNTTSLITETLPPPVSAADLERGFCPQQVAYQDILRKAIARERNPIKPSHKARANVLKASFYKAAEKVGEDCLGFLTITPKGQWGWFKMMELLKFITSELKRIFPGGLLRIADFSPQGRMHFHFVAIASANIRAGFDWDAYRRMRQLSTKRLLDDQEQTERRRLGRSLSCNPILKELWRELRLLAEKLRIDTRFGQVRIEFAPIRVSAEAAALYLVKAYYRCVRNPGRPRRGQIVGWMGAFPKALSDDKRVSASTLRYRRRRDLLLGLAGCDVTWMREAYGNRWHYRLIRADGLINTMRGAYGENEDHWPPDLLLKVADRFYPGIAEHAEAYQSDLTGDPFPPPSLPPPSGFHPSLAEEGLT